MESILWRNDDISWDSDLGKLRSIQAIFEKHNQREVYSVVPFGRAIYDSDKYTHDMPLEKLEELCGDSALSVNPEVVAFLRESITRGHKISLHGWQHTRVTDYDDQEGEIKEAKDSLEKLLGVKVQYFVPPFNHYNQHVVTACQKLNLPVAIGGGQLEKLVKQNLFEQHGIYWYHFHRFYSEPGLSPEMLDTWLSRFLYRIQ